MGFEPLKWHVTEDLLGADILFNKKLVLKSFCETGDRVVTTKAEMRTKWRTFLNCCVVYGLYDAVLMMLFSYHCSVWGDSIKKSESVRYLGGFLDKTVNFQEHVRYFCSVAMADFVNMTDIHQYLFF